MAHDFNLRAPEGANKRKRVVGRGQGSGRGTTSGKGNKGQQARSGGKTYGGFEGGQMPLYRRLAQRGFSNYPFKKSFQIVNLNEIDKRFNSGETVNLTSLHAKGLVKGRKNGENILPKNPVKILGNGELTKNLTFVLDGPNALSIISGAAKEKIKKAGGKISGEVAVPAPVSESASTPVAASEPAGSSEPVAESTEQ